MTQTPNHYTRSMPFTKASLTFLAQLTRHNDREWFLPRKQQFEDVLRAPMLALIEQLNHTLAEVAPDLVRPPEKVILRPYRDTRFSEDKRPYKTHVSAWWGHTGIPKSLGASTPGAGLYVHLSAKEFWVAAGLFRPTPFQLLETRRQIASEPVEPGGKTLRSLLDAKPLRKLLPDFDGQPLTRTPKGFAADHPAEDLLRCRRWGRANHRPAAAALEPGLAKELAKIFRTAAPLVNYLNVPLVPAVARKPLF